MGQQIVSITFKSEKELCVHFPEDEIQITLKQNMQRWLNHREISLSRIFACQLI